MSDKQPMENPPPLAGLDPADLLRQGAADDTFMDGAPSAFNPPPLEELAAIFPQFEILELIGQGGMGAVYKVRQTDLDRIVALKILPPGIGQSPEFSNRFTREARALAKLNHPGIVILHEFGQQNGLYFILMEFVDGVNLAQLMKTGRISPREALAIVPQICDALQYAHDQGIVHRDIKPENILLDKIGRVKVADFGIAKIVGDVTQAFLPDLHSPPAGMCTEAGKIIGTPQYMAPEQIDHPSDVDHRADIYALGVVFYQMLTGELPGKDLQAPSKKVHIDVRLDEIVLRAMEKEPEMRYQTAHEFRTVVDGVQAPAHVMPPSLPQPKRSMLRRWWWVFLIIFPLGLLVGLVASSMWVYVIPKVYEASSTIEVRPRDGTTQTSNFFATEFEIIKSSKSLAAVAEQLDLSKSWMTSQDSAVQKLTTIIQAQNIRGTNLIRISVRHTDKQDAAAIAKAVALNYQQSFPERVVIHEQPIEPTTPVSPNVMLTLVIGSLLGLMLSPLLAIILIAILQRLFPGEDPANSRDEANTDSSNQTGPRWIQSLIGLLLVLCLPGALLFPYLQDSSSETWHTQEDVFTIPGQMDESRVGETLAEILAPYQGVALKVDSSGKKWKISATDKDRAMAEQKLNRASSAIQMKYEEGKTRKLAESVVWESRYSISSSAMQISSRPAFVANLRRSAWVGLLLSGLGMLCLLLRCERGRFRFGNPGKLILVLVMLGCFGCLFVAGPFQSLWSFLSFGATMMVTAIIAVSLGDRFMRFEFWIVLGTWMSTVAFIVAGLPKITSGSDPGWKTVPLPVNWTGQQPAPLDLEAAAGKEPMDGIYLEAVLEWLGTIDSGGYEKAWTEAAAFARSLESPTQWATKMKAIRSPLGDVGSRIQRQRKWTSDLPGAPDGQYLIYTFGTEFESGPKIIETVTLMFEKDGNWRVMGYSIEPTTESSNEEAVVSTAEAWLLGIDAGNYGQSWKDAAYFFKAATPASRWVSMVGQMRIPVGALKSREIRQVKKVTTLTGAPDGEYFIIQFDSSFDGKGKVVEVVTFKLEENGIWKAAGYLIR